MRESVSCLQFVSEIDHHEYGGLFWLVCLIVGLFAPSSSVGYQVTKVPTDTTYPSLEQLPILLAHRYVVRIVPADGDSRYCIKPHASLSDRIRSDLLPLLSERVNAN